ncbi:unnamed protein product, partial [Iphiclides podalirius]
MSQQRRTTRATAQGQTGRGPHLRRYRIAKKNKIAAHHRKRLRKLTIPTSQYSLIPRELKIGADLRRDAMAMRPTMRQ